MAWPNPRTGFGSTPRPSGSSPTTSAAGPNSNFSAERASAHDPDPARQRGPWPVDERAVLKQRQLAGYRVDPVIGGRPDRAAGQRPRRYLGAAGILDQLDGQPGGRGPLGHVPQLRSAGHLQDDLGLAVPQPAV